MHSIGSLHLWLGFCAIIVALILVDLFLLGGRRSHAVSVKEALAWSAFWVTLALLFNAWLWWYADGLFGEAVARQKAVEFFTGYLIEKSLSVDNIFVFLLIFSFFKIPKIYQRRVLIYGVISAIVLRGIMIGIGAWLVAKAHWILYVFGAFLVITGIKMLIFSHKESTSLADNILLKWLQKRLPVTPVLHGESFFVKLNGMRYVTPLLFVLILIEFSDVIFAVDSVPAIFAVTQDPFIVFTSNIFAIMGLRALYFLLADMVERFTYLKYGLALILILIGSKMLIKPWYELSTWLALCLVACILIASVALSLALTKKQAQEP